MIIKKLYAILVSILILASFSSCDTLAKPEAQSATEKVSSVPASEAPPSSADSELQTNGLSPTNSKPQANGGSSASSEPQASSLDVTVKKLKNDKTVEKYEISHSSALIAIIRREEDGSGYSFSLLNVSTDKETSIISAEEAGSLIANPGWSFDDKYISIHEGTSQLRTTYIIDSSSLKIKTKLESYWMVWAPDSESVALCTVNREIKPTIGIGLDGTTALTICNLDSCKSKQILKGTANIVYSPQKWDKSGLYVNKTTLKPEQTEIIMVKPDLTF